MVKLIVFILVSFSIGNTFGWFLRINGRVGHKKDYLDTQTTKLQSNIHGLKSCAKSENTKLLDSIIKLIDDMVMNSKEISDSFKWAMENDNYSNLGPEIVKNLKAFFEQLFNDHSDTIIECLQKLSESDRLSEIVTLNLNYLKEVFERSIKLLEDLGRILVCDNTNSTADLLNEINSTLTRIQTILDNEELKIQINNNFAMSVKHIVDVLDRLSKDMGIKIEENRSYRQMLKKFIELQMEMATFVFHIYDKTPEEVRMTLGNYVRTLKTDIFIIIAEEFEVFSLDAVEMFLEELKNLEMQLAEMEPTTPSPTTPSPTTPSPSTPSPPSTTPPPSATPPPSTTPPPKGQDYMYDINRIEELAEKIKRVLRKKGSKNFYRQYHTRIHMNYMLESLQNIVYFLNRGKKRLRDTLKGDDLDRTLDDFSRIASDVIEHVTVKEGSEIDRTKVGSWIHEIKGALTRFGETVYDKDVNVPRSLYRGTFKRIYSALKNMYIDLKMTTDTNSKFNGVVENLNQLQTMTHCFESSLRLVDFKDETTNSNVVSYFLKYADSLIGTLEANLDLFNDERMFKLIQSTMVEIERYLWAPTHSPHHGALNDWILININTLNTLIQDFVLADLHSENKKVHDLLLRFIVNLQDFKTNVERITIHGNANTPLLIHSILEVSQSVLRYMDKTSSDESVSKIISIEIKSLQIKMSTFESAVRKMVKVSQAIRIFGKQKPTLIHKETNDPAQFRRILRHNVDIFKRLTGVMNLKRLKTLKPYMVEYQNQLQDLKIRLVREFLKRRSIREDLSEDAEEELKMRSSEDENFEPKVEANDQRKKANAFLHMITKKKKTPIGGAKRVYRYKAYY